MSAIKATRHFLFNLWHYLRLLFCDFLALSLQWDQVTGMILSRENCQTDQSFKDRFDHVWLFSCRLFLFQRRSRALLDNDELKRLYSLLEGNSCVSSDLPTLQGWLLSLVHWDVVVAQRYSTRLIIRRSWVWIPPGAGLFFLLLSLLHLWSVLNQVPQGGASLTVCCEKKKWMPCCAVLLGAKQAQLAQIG